MQEPITNQTINKEIKEAKQEVKKEEQTSNQKSFNNNNYNNHKKFFKVHKKHCVLCQKGTLWVDYKDVDLLKRYVDIEHTGKILSHYITGTCPKHQRQISNAIHRARIVALLPFIKRD